MMAVEWSVEPGAWLGLPLPAVTFLQPSGLGISHQPSPSKTYQPGHQQETGGDGQAWPLAGESLMVQDTIEPPYSQLAAYLTLNYISNSSSLFPLPLKLIHFTTYPCRPIGMSPPGLSSQ